MSDLQDFQQSFFMLPEVDETVALCKAERIRVLVEPQYYASVKGPTRRFLVQSDRVGEFRTVAMSVSLLPAYQRNDPSVRKKVLNKS